ncbi:MAG TPA: hypothetical protein VIY69_01530 [Candidatus Acidoferrales bacterium]
MEGLAAQRSGIYFLFSSRDYTILALIDSTIPAAQPDADKKDDKKDIA